MHKTVSLGFLVVLMATMLNPAVAQSRHEMCDLAQVAIKTISQKLGDSKEVTAQKSSSMHIQCFNAPLSEVRETYGYLIDNWNSIFDKPK